MSLANLPAYVNPASSLEPGGYEPLAGAHLRVALDPGGESMLNHRIFRRDFVTNRGWMEPNAVLAEMCRSRGIDISTIDLIPPEDADVIVFINLPGSREVLEDLQRRAPGIRKILIASESPVVQPHAAVEENWRIFDVVMTPNDGCEARANFRRMPLPIGNPPPREKGKEFIERKMCVLVNSNVRSGVLRAARPWQAFGGPARIRKQGWVLPWSRCATVSRGNDYHRRRDFARAFERVSQGDLEIFGRGWEPQRHGWFYRAFPERHYPGWKGTFEGDKFRLLGNYRFAFAYENFHGNEGYISEKIFDALFAGTVPLYHGDERILEILPAEAFVDRRNYRNDDEMIRDIRGWTDGRWKAAREAGQDAVRHPRLAPFSASAFAENVIAVIESVTAGRKRGTGGEACR